VRAEPQQARFVFEDPINDVVGKPGVADGLRIVHVGAEDAKRISVIPVQAVFRPEPKEIPTVLKGARSGS
jgi:hypothetical protein